MKGAEYEILKRKRAKSKGAKWFNRMAARWIKPTTEKDITLFPLKRRKK